ncbi:acyl-CoA dehydrogenase family protein [bacterium]|nr:acyl-CoA dehydrogenase family protein [bacterium]
MTEPREKDFLNIEDLFRDEELMIRDTVKKFVDKEILPEIDAHHRKATFPLKLVPLLGEIGLLGINLKGYGCPGGSNVEYGLAMQELERGDSGVRSFCSVQGSLCMFPIWAFGSEDQKKKYLPKMAEGKIIGCYGLTESEAGSDPGSLKTRARKEGDSYILNGSKMWITNGSIADLAVVWARTEEGEIKGFLVEKGTPGFETSEIKGKFSMRASVTSELIFNECRIPEKNVLPRAQGLKPPLKCLTEARYGISWGALGSAQACYETALKYARERIQFGKPIASFQLVQHKLVNMLTAREKGKLLSLQVGREKDKGTANHAMVSMAKMNNVQMARNCARTAREILGANGICDDYVPIRHMMNMETVYTYEGTHDIHELIIGRAITGLNAFS